MRINVGIFSLGSKSDTIVLCDVDLYKRIQILAICQLFWQLSWMFWMDGSDGRPCAISQLAGAGTRKRSRVQGSPDKAIIRRLTSHIKINPEEFNGPRDSQGIGWKTKLRGKEREYFDSLAEAISSAFAAE